MKPISATAWLLFLLVAAACGGDDPPESDDDGGSSEAGSSSAPSSGSGQGADVCSPAEQDAINTCAGIYEQIHYPYCSGVAACLKNEYEQGQLGISPGCYNCALSFVNSACSSCSCCQ